MKELSYLSHSKLIKGLLSKNEKVCETGYEVEITPENFKAGNGTLTMKNGNEYVTDSIHFETHAIISGEDIVVHYGSESGAGIDIAKESTGAIEGKGYIDKDGSPITLSEVINIYMIVEWWDTGKSDTVKERIELYNRSNKEDTFIK